jgi:hypothetical protein
MFDLKEKLNSAASLICKISVLLIALTNSTTYSQTVPVELYSSEMVINISDRTVV